MRSKTKEPASQLLLSLRSRRFNRYPLQPLENLRLMTLLKEAVSRQSKITCVLIWGCSPKEVVNLAESLALRRLAYIDQEAKKIHPPGMFTHLLFADCHGNLNGISDRTISSYYTSLMLLISRLGLEHLVDSSLLSTIWDAYGINSSSIVSRAEDLPSELCTPFLRNQFERAAQRHYLLGSQTQGARLYYAARVLESAALDNLYGGGAVFLSYNPLSYSEILPERMPKLYIYPHGKHSELPWFSQV